MINAINRLQGVKNTPSNVNFSYYIQDFETPCIVKETCLSHFFGTSYIFQAVLEFVNPTLQFAHKQFFIKT